MNLSEGQNYYDQIQEASDFLRPHLIGEIPIGLVLGTGLASVEKEIESSWSVSYKEIPHFPESTVEGHTGRLIVGLWDGVPIIALAGRFHYYEGYSTKELTFPIRVLRALGVEKIFLSNASGSTNAQIEAGDLVVVKDHINLHPENPLRGQNDNRLGIRFPDMLRAYDPELRKLAMDCANALGLDLKQGVYVGLQGPNLETPAEYKFINIIGGDLVGMSTVPEVIAAVHSGMSVFCISVVSNKCYPIEGLSETTIEEVLDVVNASSSRMISLVRAMLKKI